MLLEVCTTSLRSARLAEAAGAGRIELCQSLDVGGLTPSHGLIQLVMQDLAIPIHVLIRPRPGNFVYNYDEYLIMLADIQACHDLQCDGVVFGILNADHQVDVPRMRQLVRAAQPMQVTFHRAFDDCVDQHQALEDIASVGCTRILTSGGKSTALEGCEKIAALNAQAGARLMILPGAGINADNVKDLILTSGVEEVHASASRTKEPENNKHQSLFPRERTETDNNMVASLVETLNMLRKGPKLQ